MAAAIGSSSPATLKEQVVSINDGRMNEDRSCDTPPTGKLLLVESEVGINDLQFTIEGEHTLVESFKATLASFLCITITVIHYGSTQTYNMENCLLYDTRHTPTTRAAATC